MTAAQYDTPVMGISLVGACESILMKAFGRPQGALGRLGGLIMARANRECAAWVIDLLEIRPHDRILEVGFGPGVGVELLTKLVTTGHVAEVDPSREMVEQATTRNAGPIESGQVDLRLGAAESLPFGDNSFDKTFAINSMQVWTDSATGLRELQRVMKVGGRIALAFTPYSGVRNGGIAEQLTALGFTDVRKAISDGGVCVLATKP